MTTNKLIAWLTGILTLSLAVFSFVLSFNALTDLAAQHNVSIPALFPFLVEFAVVIFSLNALYRSLNGLTATWQWSLIIGSSLLAGTFNVLHADPDIISRSMAAMPSLFLLLSFETFLGQLKHAVNRQTVLATLAELTEQAARARAELTELQTEIETLTGKRDAIKAKLDQLRKEKKQASYTGISDETRIKAELILAERSDISGAELGRLLGKSDTTGRRLKKELLPALNGNGNGGD